MHRGTGLRIPRYGESGTLGAEEPAFRSQNPEVRSENFEIGSEYWDSKTHSASVLGNLLDSGFWLPTHRPILWFNSIAAGFARGCFSYEQRKTAIYCQSTHGREGGASRTDDGHLGVKPYSKATRGKIDVGTNVV
jgi:hypothetical protein